MANVCNFHIIQGIEWRIVFPSPYKLITSPKFSLLGSEWRLHLTSLDRGSYKIVVSLIPERSEGEGDTLRTPLQVVTYLGDPKNTQSVVAFDFKRHQVTKRAKVDFSHNYGNYSLLLSEVRIVCLFYDATTESNTRPHKSVQVSSEVPRDLETFVSDFTHLLEDEILPDVKLECGGRTLRAHRSVLATRSKVFRAMFENEMLESETRAVKILDVDVAVLEKLLKFVYTGKPEDISESTAADLYEAADKYDVHSLKTACAYWIVRNLTVENCVKYLVVADSHSDADLKATVVSFILENQSVLKSETWLEFSKEPSKLAHEVFQAYVAATLQ